MQLLSKGATVTTWAGSPTTQSGLWNQNGYRPFLGFESRTLADFAGHHDYDAMYRTHVWVYTAVNLRSANMARLPFHAYVRDADGSKKRDTGTLAKLLAKPHPQLSMRQIILWLCETSSIHGCAYVWIRERVLGQPAVLQPMHPSRVELRDNGETYRMHAADRSTFTDAPWQNVIPITDNFGGISPLEPLRMALRADVDAVIAQASNWKRGARPSLVLKHPDKMSDPAIRSLGSQIAELHAGPMNAGRPLILQEGMEAMLLPFDASSSAFIDSRKLTREEVAAAFRMPPPVLGILDNATLANVRELYTALARDVLAPMAVLFADAFNSRLVEGQMMLGNRATDQMNFVDEPGVKFVEFSFEEVLRGTPEAQMESLSKQVQGGLITANEARKALNRPALDGGDQLLINGALVPIALAGTSPQQQLQLGV